MFARRSTRIARTIAALVPMEHSRRILFDAAGMVALARLIMGERQADSLRSFELSILDLFRQGGGDTIRTVAFDTKPELDHGVVSPRFVCEAGTVFFDGMDMAYLLGKFDLSSANLLAAQVQAAAFDLEVDSLSLARRTSR